MKMTAKTLTGIAVLTAVGLTIACGGGHRASTVTVPPRLDLREYGRAAALVEFTSENAKGSLHELATRRFSEQVLSATRGVEMIELGSADPLLQQSGERQFGAATAKLVGSSHEVPVVFAGNLKVSNIKASGGMVVLSLPRIEATVSVELNVALYSTQSGGTLWRSGAAATEKVGQLSMAGGQPSFSAKDPNAAYGHLVDRLVSIVTRDLYPTYERR
jgi:hypothetical protein